jgi:hypothetical protein
MIVIFNKFDKHMLQLKITTPIKKNYITNMFVIQQGLYIYPLLFHLSEKISHALLKELLGTAE